MSTPDKWEMLGIGQKVSSWTECQELDKMPEAKKMSGFGQKTRSRTKLSGDRKNFRNWTNDQE